MGKVITNRISHSYNHTAHMYTYTNGCSFAHNFYFFWTEYMCAWVLVLLVRANHQSKWAYYEVSFYIFLFCYSRLRRSHYTTVCIWVFITFQSFHFNFTLRCVSMRKMRKNLCAWNLSVFFSFVFDLDCFFSFFFAIVGVVRVLGVQLSSIFLLSISNNTNCIFIHTKRTKRKELWKLYKDGNNFWHHQREREKKKERRKIELLRVCGVKRENRRRKCA